MTYSELCFFGVIITEGWNTLPQTFPIIVIALVQRSWGRVHFIHPLFVQWRTSDSICQLNGFIVNYLDREIIFECFFWKFSDIKLDYFLTFCYIHLTFSSCDSCFTPQMSKWQIGFLSCQNPAFFFFYYCSLWNPAAKVHICTSGYWYFRLCVVLHFDHGPKKERKKCQRR